MKKNTLFITCCLLAGFVCKTPEKLTATVIINYSNVISQSPKEFGTQTWWTDQDSAIFTAGWLELGAKVVRLPLAQGIFEPINDDDNPETINWDGFRFNAPSPLPLAPERTVSPVKFCTAIRDAGLTIMLCPFYIAGWNSFSDRGYTSPFPPRSLAEHKEFLYAFLHWLVNEISFPPEKIILEVMNEPDWPALGFWENWDMNDIVNVCRISREAADAVHPAIRVIGITECQGVNVVTNLMENYNGASFLDGFSFHYYGVDFSVALSRATALSNYQIPIYLTEYGNYTTFSEGIDGALWHSYTLAKIWNAGLIRAIQYPMTDFPSGQPDQDDITRFALQLDWRNSWRKKPAYWVFANFWHFMVGTEIIKTTTEDAIDVIAGKKEIGNGKYEIAIWVTNPTTFQYHSIIFQLLNFPKLEANIKIFNNLQGINQIGTVSIDPERLNFSCDIPAMSSFCFLISANEKPIAVEYHSFKAFRTFAGIELKWSTISESNNFGFEIQRSETRLNHFWKIGFIPGHGTTTAPYAYFFTDTRLSHFNYFYRIKQIDTDGTCTFSETIGAILERPLVAELLQSFPNPFNTSATIHLKIAHSERVILRIFNVRGDNIRTLVDENKEAGYVSVVWDGTDNQGYNVATGIYLCQLQTRDQILTQKMLLIR